MNGIKERPWATLVGSSRFGDYHNFATQVFEQVSSCASRKISSRMSGVTANAYLLILLKNEKIKLSSLAVDVKAFSPT